MELKKVRLELRFSAKIRLAYISSDKDIWEYLGPRYSFIGFDESTFHSEFQVRNMLGRLSYPLVNSEENEEGEEKPETLIDRIRALLWNTQAILAQSIR